MTYVWLVLAIAFEAGWAIGMKLSEGFTRPLASVLTVVFYVLSLVALTLATRRLDVGVAYAIWAGAGAALIATFGIVWLREPATPLKIASLALVIAGVVGLNLSGAGHALPAGEVRAQGRD